VLDKIEFKFSSCKKDGTPDYKYIHYETMYMRGPNTPPITYETDRYMVDWHTDGLNLCEAIFYFESKDGGLTKIVHLKGREVFYDVMCDSSPYAVNTPLTMGKDGYPERKVSGCYIATSIYGSYDCPEVWILRRYRDLKLASTRPGRLFILLYYRFSPSLVRRFGDSKLFQKVGRAWLDKLVTKLRSKGYSDSVYYDEVVMK